MTDQTTIPHDDVRFPLVLDAYLDGRTPAALHLLGDPCLLPRASLGLFCSTRCPGRLVDRTYDLAQALRAAGIAVMGGFHTPMEQECLRLLLCSPNPVLLCPARAVPARVPEAWRKPLGEGRLLIVSRFEPKLQRPTRRACAERNDFVAALAAAVFVPHAAAQSHTFEFCRKVIAWGKPLYTLDAPENEPLIMIGAKTVEGTDVRALGLGG